MVAARNSRITVITGGGSGIGRATALRLARKGDTVCLCDLNEAGLEETAALIQSDGSTAFTAIFDVRDQAQVQAWIAEIVGRFDKVDCLHRSCCRIVSHRSIATSRRSKPGFLLIGTALKLNAKHSPRS